MGKKSIYESLDEKKIALIHYCERNQVMGKILSPMKKVWQKTGLGPFLRDHNEGWHAEQDAMHEKYRRADELHKQELSKFSEMLEDEVSRKTLEQVLAYRRTWDSHELDGIVSPNQYFEKDIFAPLKDEVFVDGGAYIGDTIENYMGFSGGVFQKIYAWEPDERNLVALKRNTQALGNIVYVPCGLWSEKTQLHFQAEGTKTSMITDSAEQATMVINVDSIDNVCADDKVTFIKMDIEGSEMEALKGAVNVIRRDKPRLAICVYHKPEDMYEIPFWIKDLVPEYKFYLRHYSKTIYDTVLFATL